MKEDLASHRITDASKLLELANTISNYALRNHFSFPVVRQDPEQYRDLIDIDKIEARAIVREREGRGYRSEPWRQTLGELEIQE